MPKMKRNKLIKPREKIPRQAKSDISKEEIKMIKEVLQRERKLKRKCQSKGGSKNITIERKCASINHNLLNDEIYSDQIESLEKEKINDASYNTKSTEENFTLKESSSRLKKSGLSHFMDLEERKDLLMCQGDDPLCINGPEPFDSIDWVSVKQEVPDDVEVSQVIFTDIPLKAVEEPQTFVPSPLQSTSPSFSPSSGEKSEEKIIIQNSREENNIPESKDMEDNDPWWDDHNGSSDKEEDECDDGEKGSDFKLSLKQRNRPRPHSCDICNKMLSTKGTLRLHKKKKHQILMTFKCELCVTNFNTRRDLIKHRNEIHRGKDGKFTCSDCGVVRNDFRNFLNHLKTHYEDGLVLYNRNSERSKDIVFSCSKCDKVFNKEEDYHVHRNLIHGDDDNDTINSKLKQQEKNYICHTCGKRFAFGCLLRDHINLHTGIKPYLCQVCGRSFSQKASLKQHARTHNSVRPFQCTVCTQGFFGKGDLKKHMRKHTGERPYVCEMCGDGFSQSSHLGVHRRSHTGERPYKCDVCSRGFTKKGDVVRHRRIHTGELPYLCQVCGRAFRQSTQCANHIKNHHPDALVTVSKNPAPVSQWTF